MSDNKQQTAADRQRISLEEAYERREWANSLDCSVEQLTAAVAAVGHSAERVREYLRRAGG